MTDNFVERPDPLQAIGPDLPCGPFASVATSLDGINGTRL